MTFMFLVGSATCISNMHSKTRHVFLLYENDLPLHVNYTKLEMFADLTFGVIK